MKTRAQIYGHEAAGILRDITTYHSIRREQLYKLYKSQKENVINNLLSYLVKQGRITYIETQDIYCDDTSTNIDSEMIAALWILIDLYDQVEYHTSGDFPIKLFAFSGGEVYEIVYVAIGRETIIEQALQNPDEEQGKRILIVEDLSQINDMCVPDIAAYCTVSDKGEVKYYKAQRNQKTNKREE